MGIWSTSANRALVGSGGVVDAGTYGATFGVTPGYPSPCEGFPITDTATGTGSHLGRFTATYPHCVNFAANTFSGTATFNASNGDQLVVLLGGSADDPTCTTTCGVSFTGTIIGGTGRFEGAEGTLTGTPWRIARPGRIGWQVLVMLARAAGCTRASRQYELVRKAEISPTSSLSSGGGARFEKGLVVERPDESGGDQQLAWHANRPVMTIAHVLVKVLQRSVDDEKGFGVMSNPSLPVRRRGEPGLHRSMGPIPGRREGAQR